MRFRHDHVKTLLETLERKLKILIITESRLTDNDSPDRYELDDHQLIESTPRKFFERRSGGVAFFVKEGNNYCCIEFQNEIGRSIIQVNLCKDVVSYLYSLYTEHIPINAIFFTAFDVLLNFLKSMESETIIFGDFNIDTVKKLKDKAEYTKFLAAYDYEVRYFTPIEVIPTSKTCLDHMITERTICLKRIQTTISDHFTVAANMPAK